MNFPEFRNREGEKLDTSFHEGSREGVLLILGHGLTGNKDRPLLVELAKGLSKRGWPCLRLSFSGNGNSEGRFEDATITKGTEDLQAVLDALPSGLQVAYCGHSMGGAIGTLTAAADVRIQVLITVSGMVYTANFCEREFDDLTPGEDVMWEDPKCPLTQAFIDDLTDIGDTLDVAHEIDVPWLFIHGTDDDVVPILDSEDAFATTDTVKEIIEIDGADHTFDAESYPQVVDAVDAWLNEHMS
ncbi:MAG: alpha/beta hydrolase [Verrucomicrobiales bacterium VVV1]|nr:MAG: alpha/beta hydrolase [Verrucomicrobiales bacterium VVV1]